MIPTLAICTNTPNARMMHNDLKKLRKLRSREHMLLLQDIRYANTDNVRKDMQ